MAWPTANEYYTNIDGMRMGYAAIARAIAEFEPVTMLANESDAHDAEQRCGPDVEVLVWLLDDSWTRDTGPTFLTNDVEVAATDWQFNAYGKTWFGHTEDAQIARRILEHTSMRRFEAPIFLEEGAIHTDGEGTLLTTDSVALNPNRNPHLDEARANSIFHEYLGIDKVIWLNKVMEYDDTDGHVDNLACFARPGLVLAISETDKTDPHFAAIQANLKTLRQAKDAKGRKLDVVEIHQPTRQEYNGQRLPFSYINFYIANDAIIVPTFNDSMDEAARATLAKEFSERTIVQVDGIEVTKAGGCVHCITQQQPLGTNNH
jgi:agmatine deiminase